MIQNILWLALGFLILASAIPLDNKFKLKISGLGWVFFSIHWLFQTPHYYELADYVNILLSIAASFISLYIGYVLFINHKSIQKEINGINITKSLFTATTAAAVGGLSYFAFSEIPLLNEWLIKTVTDQTVWIGTVFGVVATRVDWNIIAINGYKVEIVLACTAIESIALFIGLIASASTSFKRSSAAFLVSVPVIYILNLIRNIFVAVAYGMTWFGDPDTSFYIAHSVIAKIGSLIALFIVAYLVLKLLPEIIDMIDGVLNLIGRIFKNAG